jgi:hypothetical protein
MSAPLHLRRVARFMLVWLGLVLGAAVASPLVHPQAMTMVCTAAGGLTWVPMSDDGSPAQASSHLDCPLCVPISAPPPAAVLAPLPPSLPTARIAPVAAPTLQLAKVQPWQARAPPPV